jgi:hypothetical protein
MATTIQDALTTATKNWHEATRRYERAAADFADAQTRLQQCERDLHELARAIEVVEARPAAELGELHTAEPTPLGTVTMPIVAPSLGASSDGVDAAAIVLEQMRGMRLGSP